VSSIVEIDGVRSGSTGYFGVNPYFNVNATNNTEIVIVSLKDSVQLALLPSIY
jgi:hypothetical protein